MKRFSANVFLFLAVTAPILSPALTNEAAASSVVHLDLAELSARAEHVLVGQVEKVESHFVAPGSRYIVTDVTLVTEQRVLGVSASSRFTVRHLGGEIGKVGQLVYGEASYRVGEHVILFAAERQGAFFAVGMAQGVMHVYVDDAGVLRVKSPSAEGRTVDDVVDQVRTIVARRTGK